MGDNRDEISPVSLQKLQFSQPLQRRPSLYFNLPTPSQRATRNGRLHAHAGVNVSAIVELGVLSFKNPEVAPNQ